MSLRWLLAFVLTPAVSSAQDLVRVMDGTTQGNGFSSRPCISADSRWVAFQTDATSFIGSDTNVTDIYLYDRLTSSITRVNAGSDFGEANNASSNPVISFDGSSIAFASSASNYVLSDTNGTTDIFLFKVQEERHHLHQVRGQPNRRERERWLEQQPIDLGRWPGGCFPVQCDQSGCRRYQLEGGHLPVRRRCQPDLALDHLGELRSRHRPGAGRRQPGGIRLRRWALRGVRQLGDQHRGE